MLHRLRIALACLLAPLLAFFRRPERAERPYTDDEVCGAIYAVPAHFTVSAVTVNHIASRMALKLFDHDPGGTGAVVVSGDGGTTKNYLAMGAYQNFAALVMNSVSTSASGPTLVELVAATDSSGTNATAIVTSGTVASITVGDNVFVECDVDQINEVGKAAGLNFTHITARITTSNSGDECVVGLLRFNPTYPQSGLTANNIT